MRFGEQFTSGGPAGAEGEARTALVHDVDRLVHKLRTPLNSLALNADLLASVSQPKPGKEALHARALKSLQSEVDRLDRIAGDFQRYVGAAVVESRTAAAGSILEGALARIRAGNGADRIELSTPGGPLPAVVGNPDLLESALAELLRNALETSSAKATVEARAEDGTLRIDVADRGPGIELEPKERAFELFLSTKQGHLGLGLTFARRVARLHGGDVHVVSTGPQGTTVRLSLPIA